MTKTNNIYIPFNNWTFESEDKTLWGITDYAVHSLEGISYTEEELEYQDDTMRVVEEIEKTIDQCGGLLKGYDYLISQYDENGNLTEEATLDYIEEESSEHEIELFAFPATLVKVDDSQTFANNGGVIPSRGLFGKTFYSFDPNHLKELYENAYKGKVAVKMVVSPKTLIADHFNELCGKGIDVREGFIYGIVDIEQLVEELKKRGINITLSTFNYAKEERMAIELCSRGIYKYEIPESEPLTEITFDSLLQNSIDTELNGHLSVKMTLGEYLRKKQTKEGHRSLK